MVLYRCKFNDCLNWYFLCKSCLDYVKNMVKTTYMVALEKVKIIRISVITKLILIYQPNLYFNYLLKIICCTTCFYAKDFNHTCFFFTFSD